VDYEKLSSDRLGESFADIRARVESARARQRVRFAEAVNVVSNSDMRVAEVRQPQVQIGRVQRKSRARRDIVLCMSQLQLSTRGYHRILKLSRTIADLAGSDAIQSAHLAKALHASQSSKDHDG
jgi:magnesium chelatase family protein